MHRQSRNTSRPQHKAHNHDPQRPSRSYADRTQARTHSTACTTKPPRPQSDPRHSASTERCPPTARIGPRHIECTRRCPRQQNDRSRKASWRRCRHTTAPPDTVHTRGLRTQLARRSPAGRCCTSSLARTRRHRSLPKTLCPPRTVRTGDRAPVSLRRPGRAPRGTAATECTTHCPRRRRNAQLRTLRTSHWTLR